MDCVTSPVYFMNPLSTKNRTGYGAGTEPRSRRDGHRGSRLRPAGATWHNPGRWWSLRPLYGNDSPQSARRSRRRLRKARVFSVFSV